MRFRGMFLVTLDRSDIANPDGTGSFNKVNLVLNFFVIQVMVMAICPRSASRL
jgi:hypothetical protein